jgi:hypothetical protein
LEHYGESIRVGHKHILLSLPRLLMLPLLPLLLPMSL